ncbi:MAG: ECF transporter S component, partial [Enterococcus faecium]
MNKKFTVKHIVAIGIGAAVFFILKRFVTIPKVVQNTDIATAYPFLALLGVVYGQVVAGLAGFIG